MSARLVLRPEAAHLLLNAQAPAALSSAARLLLAESARRVPVDSGALKRSGRVEAGARAAAVRYTAPHAAAVHSRHPRGRNFLSGPARETGVQARMLLALGEKIRF